MEKVRTRKRPDTAAGRRKGSVVPPASQAAEERIEFLADLLPQLARAIGPLCELVLHERTNGELRVKAIANNHISHRTVGGPPGVIIHNGKEIHDPQDALFNYTGLTEDRKRLRCSLIPIRCDGEVIGAICVNFLVHDLQNASDALGALLQVEAGSSQVQEFVPANGDILEGIVELALRERGRPAHALTKPERLELIAILRARGALSVRGAIGRIADRLGLSRTAVYNYLRELDEAEP